MTRLLAAALVGLLALPALAQQANDQGLQLMMTTTPKPGTVRAFVRFTDPAVQAQAGASPSTSAFSATLSTGGAKVVSVKPFSALGLETVTIAAVDRSGSFARGMPAAWQVIEHLSQGVSPTNRLGLMQFGLELKDYDTRSAPAAVQADIATAKGLPHEKRTLLLSSTRSAIQRAAKEGSKGFREVMLFTDAGEESAAMNARAVAEEARAKGVRVSIFLMIPPNPSVKLASRIDELRNIRLSSGGIETTLSDPAKAIADIDAALKARDDWYAVDLQFCGMKPGQFDGSMRVDFGQGKAFTADVPFKTLLGPEAQAACPGAAIACGEPCASWQQCDTTKGACVAKACTTDAECAPGGHCANKLCATGQAGLPWWVWLVGGSALALIALGLVLMRKKPQPAPLPEEPKVEEPPPPPPEEPKAEAPPPDPFTPAAVSLEALPETHLVAISGPFPPGQKWRLHQKITRVGAAAESDLKLDVPQISGQHAEFHLFPNGNLFVKDNGSSNGTFVNGRRLAKGERTALKVGDQVQLSSALLIEIQRPGIVAPPPEKASEAPAEPSATEPKPRAKKQTIIDRGD